MKIVNVHEAKTHLSRLLRRVAEGEEIVIARSGKPIARLVPALEASGQRELGTERGRIIISEDFDAPLPPDVLESFSGEDSA